MNDDFLFMARALRLAEKGTHKTFVSIFGCANNRLTTYIKTCIYNYATTIALNNVVISRHICHYQWQT